MCIIAGYTGYRSAAPILVEMLKNTEYISGGLSTGIATIHEGKLYTRKVVGDVDTLLRETDALSLPGTTGIIHSRTGGNHVEHAHPFLSDDGKLALVLNGTNQGGGSRELFAASNGIMNEFLDKGIKIRTAINKAEDPANAKRILKNGYIYHDSEPYALIVGEGVRGLTGEELRAGVAREIKKALETLPIDIITAMVHEDLPDTITFGNISRPMSIGLGDGEIYTCTVPFGLPDRIQKGSVVFLPPTTVAQVTPKGLDILSTSLDGVRVEGIDFRIAKEFRLGLEEMLKYGEDNGIDVTDILLKKDWDSVWSKPLVDMDRYALENSRLKPVFPAMLEGLWSFHKEGRLGMKLGKRANKSGNEKSVMRFYLKN
jgi:glucosamine--fructose-6-phosphate aminotransferase (isomerizing)